jgi:hypothetical protein
VNDSHLTIIRHQGATCLAEDALKIPIRYGEKKTYIRPLSLKKRLKTLLRGSGVVNTWKGGCDGEYSVKKEVVRGKKYSFLWLNVPEKGLKVSFSGDRR